MRGIRKSRMMLRFMASCINKNPLYTEIKKENVVKHLFLYFLYCNFIPLSLENASGITLCLKKKIHLQLMVLWEKPSFFTSACFQQGHTAKEMTLMSCSAQSLRLSV